MIMNESIVDLGPIRSNQGPIGSRSYWTTINYFNVTTYGQKNQLGPIGPIRNTNYAHAHAHARAHAHAHVRMRVDRGI
jgi:hypothetical protein